MNNPEFQNAYHERTGTKYNEEKPLSKAWLAKNFLPQYLVSTIYRKMDESGVVATKDMWRNFEGCKKVIEIGCGKGGFLRAAPEGVSVYGTEMIEEEVKKCREKGLNVIMADIQKKLPFKKDSFDGVYMCHVIEHFEKPVLAIEEAKRILKPGGKIIILTPNFAAVYKKFYNDYTHKTPFTKRGLFKLLSDLGFKKIRVKNDYYHTNSPLFILLSFFPNLALSFGKFIGRFYGLGIVAIAEK